MFFLRLIKDDNSYHFINRGKIYVKGLGLRITYFVEDHSPQVTNDEDPVPTSTVPQLQLNGHCNGSPQTNSEQTGCPVSWSVGSVESLLNTVHTNGRTRNSQVAPVSTLLQNSHTLDNNSSHTHKKCSIM